MRNRICGSSLLEGQYASVGVGIFAAKLLGLWLDKVCIDQSNISDCLNDSCASLSGGVGPHSLARSSEPEDTARQYVHRSKQHRRSLRVLPVNVMACSVALVARFEENLV